VSEGVVFTALEHSVGEADAAAFIRPNISDARIKEVIARAFSHAGKPYDFDFDFFSTDKLVCSEVVYRAFGDIHLPLVDVMGRKTLPPIEIVRQCVRERAHGPEQFMFVAYLNGNEARGAGGVCRREGVLRDSEPIRDGFASIQALKKPDASTFPSSTHVRFG
jgi:hypothetical protein